VYIQFSKPFNQQFPPRASPPKTTESRVYASERQQAILAKARLEGRVEVKSLADELDVTPETIRRDLTVMERRGLVQRAHGGAIAVDRLGVEPGVADRDAVYTDEKERIARRALEELPDGGSIIIDAGTTTSRLANMLPTHIELTVVTNSIPIAATLATRPNIQLHLLGGLVRSQTLAVVGTWPQDELATISVDVAFLGINGLTADRGLTTPDLEEARIKTLFIKSARRTVVLADHTKFGRQDFANVAPLNLIDTVITDSGIDNELRLEIELGGPDVIVA
jgi:DeoR family fructose operon transcriptional repressor